MCKNSYFEDKLVHQKADTRDNILWKFERNQRIINSVACCKKNSKKVSYKCTIVMNGVYQSLDKIRKCDFYLLQ